MINATHFVFIWAMLQACPHTQCIFAMAAIDGDPNKLKVNKNRVKNARQTLFHLLRAHSLRVFKAHNWRSRRGVARVVYMLR